MTPPYGLRAAGPLMAGGCAGAASGAGTRFWKAGICGASDPRSVVGLRTKPPRPDRWAKPPPCPPPPRAKPGVDATTQAVVTKIAAKTRFMIVIPHFAPPLDAVESNHPRTETFNLRCLALTNLALIRALNRAMDEPQPQVTAVRQNRFVGEIDRAVGGGRLASARPPALRVQLMLSRKRMARPCFGTFASSASKALSRNGRGHLTLRPLTRLAQNEERECASSEA
jgi:hypothetical protein